MPLHTVGQFKSIAALTHIISPEIPGFTGVLVMAVVMLVYETLGGMRSVAWTGDLSTADSCCWHTL